MTRARQNPKSSPPRAQGSKVVANIAPAGNGRIVRHPAGFDLSFSARSVARALAAKIEAQKNAPDDEKP
ncbi:MAG: hypothetical protein AB7O67_16765 [Vicinamibacterales bacterium]